MRNKGGITFFSFMDGIPRRNARGLVVFLIIALLGAGIWVSPAVAAYVDSFSGGNVILAAPDAVEDSYFANEDHLLTVTTPGILTNDVLGDGLTKTAHLVSSTANGILTLAEDGSFTYGPILDFNGADTFVYNFDDGVATSDNATVTITVNPVNDAPEGTDNTIFINEDTSYSFQADDFGFSDPIDDPANGFLAVKITTLPVSGVLELLGSAVGAGNSISVLDLPDLVFTPAANDDGTSGFTFQVQDNGGTANDGDDLDLFADTITFDITPVNDPPVLDPILNKNVAELANLPFQAIGTDPDFPPNTLTYSLTGAPSGATIGSSSGIFSWTPTEAQGPDVVNFSVCVTDAIAAPQCLPVQVTVSEINVAPVLNAIGNKNVNELQLLTFSAIANDSDVPANSFSFSLDAGAPTGASISTGGVFNWTPTALQGPASFQITIRVTDNGIPALFDIETITVAVDNLPPVVQPYTDTILEGNTSSILTSDLFPNIIDPEGDPITFGDVVLDSAVNGAAELITSGPDRYVFTPTTINFNGLGSYRYTVSDGTSTVEGQVNINITSVNDAPAGTNKTLLTSEDTSFSILDTDFGFSDPNELSANVFSRVRITTPPTSGSLTLVSSPVSLGQFISVADLVAGNLVYHPALNGSGTPYATFTFQVEDDGGTANGGINLDASANIITINVNPLNDAPVAVADSYNTIEETQLTVGAPGVLGNDGDPDGDPLTAVPNGAVIGGNVILNSDGSFTFTPAPNFNGAASFSYHATDGTLDSNVVSVTIEVSNVNDAPVLTTIPPQSGPEMVNLTFTAVATDVDTPPQTLTFSLGGTPPVGASIGALTGAFNRNPTEAQGPFSNNIQVCVSDSVAPLQCQLVSVTISEVNLPPVAENDTVQVLEDSTANVFTPLTNDTDPDLPANPLSLYVVGNPSHGGRSWDPDANTVTYTPTGNYFGSDVIAYGIKDAAFSPFLTSNAQINITILSVNDAPVGAPNIKNINEDNLFTFAAADFAFTDPNDSPANLLSGVKITTLPALGVLKLSNVAVTAGQVIPAASLSNLTFTPALNGNGAPYTSFTFQVQDNGTTANGGIDLDPTPRSFTFNVTALADAPIGTADAYTFNTFSTLPFSVAAPGVLANDSDGDTFANWTLSVFTQPAHGTVVLSQNGSFTYTQTGSPPLEYVDTFIYRITDTTPATIVDVTVTLTVDLQRPPMANWELPFVRWDPNQPVIVSLLGSTTLNVSVPNSSDVVGMKFTIFNGPNRIELGISSTFTDDGQKKFFTMTVPNSVFPLGLSQVRADSIDDAGNIYLSTPGDISTFPNTFVQQNYGYVFLPLIMR